MARGWQRPRSDRHRLGGILVGDIGLRFISLAAGRFIGRSGRQSYPGIDPFFWHFIAGVRRRFILCRHLYAPAKSHALAAFDGLKVAAKMVTLYLTRSHRLTSVENCSPWPIPLSCLRPAFTRVLMAAASADGPARTREFRS